MLDTIFVRIKINISKMKVILLLVLLIWINNIESRISIQIQSDRSPSVTSVGVDVQLVTDDDINNFFSDVSLKDAVKTHYGVKPSNVYYKKPTPWGELYTRFNWEQVTKVTSVKFSRLKSYSKKPLVILTQDFQNSSNNTIKVNSALSHTVENTLAISWSKTNEFMISQSLDYNLNVIFAKMEGSTSISHSTGWGQSEEKSEAITIGSTSAVETELQPGQAVTAELSVSSGLIEMEIVYKASLRGNVAVNMKKKLNGHHFWGPTIQDVMKSAGITNEKTIMQTVKVGFHADAKLQVFDKSTGLPL